MPFDVIKFAFVAGEVAENFHGRVDLEKYDLALAKATNYFVDYRGGLSNRGGTELVDFLKDDDKDILIVPFKFTTDIANTNLIVFGHQYIRFVQDGAYVLETLKPVLGITQANPGIVSVTAHGYVAGDWVRFASVGGMTDVNGQTFQVTAPVAANSFALKDVFGNDVDTTQFGLYTNGGQVGRVYTLASPYVADDLDILRYVQRKDVIRLTHANYKTQNLQRLGVANWTLTEEVRGRALTHPTGVAVQHSVSAIPSNLLAATAYVVTAVNDRGDESLQSDIVILDVGETTNPTWSSRVTWTAVTGARFYRVYRSRVIRPKTSVNQGVQLGYIGKTFGPNFIDNAIVPDFSIVPPFGNDPFADNRIESITVTAGGANYTRASKVTVTDPTGTGFRGYPIVNTSVFGSGGDELGPVSGIVIIDGGRGYTAPSISVDIGTGATFTSTQSAASGNDPGVSAIFQQRQIYAGIPNDPLRLYCSRTGQLSNFDASDVVRASDAYDFEFDSDDASPILHMVATRGGLLTFTPSGIWQLTAASNQAVTPTNALAEPQLYNGCTSLAPLLIDSDVLYAETGRINLLTYIENNRVYSRIDVTKLANHLFSVDNQVVSWTFANDPYKLVLCCRQDGSIASFASQRDEEVYAWTPFYTKGLFNRVATLREDTINSVYVIVTRWIRGRKTKVLERFVPRLFNHVEDAWFVDCGIALPSSPGSGTLTVGAKEGVGVVATSTSSAFTSDDVGKVIRVGSGKMTIVSYSSATQVKVDIIRPITQLIPETDDPLPSSEWTMDTPVSAVSGLWAYEDMELTGLFDGNYLPPQKVVNGQITLPVPATRVILGLGYESIAQNLPPTLTNERIEDKRKMAYGLALRVKDTRGLKVGTSFDNLYAVPERTTELAGEPTDLQRGIKVVSISGLWREDLQEIFKVDVPLPVTILGFITQMEVGDDPN
jgi:hypothetical protein